MPRLASPIARIKSEYEVVVVGSGYGGGISASRMARAGRRVCMLERGKEKVPGEYPDTQLEAMGEIQANTSRGHVGPETGMFLFHVNPDLNVLVGCGLGGTSLINANVSLRAVPGVFADPRWPDELRGPGSAVLDPYYKLAEDMLQPNPYPDEYPRLAKLEAHRTSASATGASEAFYKPPINVHFRDETNPAGVEQKKCILCGDCVSGCNHGAKNTTLMNYLPDAWNHGAEIFTEVSVRYVEFRSGKWLVHFQPVGRGREKFGSPELFVKCDVVILAAGTLGSTEILLRSREKGLTLSDRLGRSFSGNGDVLGFGYNCDTSIHGVGFGSRPRGESNDVGPCITSIIDRRATPRVEEGYVIEEGSIPGALGGMLPAALAAGAGLMGQDTDTGLVDRLKERGREVESVLRGPYQGAVDNTQTYLVMSHDGSDGDLRLEGDRIRVDWPHVGDKPIFRKVNDRLREAVAALGGTWMKNPIWSKPFDRDLISVHPLGGCCMANSAEGGVVNHKGQVFRDRSGTATHEGLYVADGAIIPMSLGVNPLLTISALAERSSALLAADRGWIIDYTLGKKLRAAPEPPRMGIRFTETMRGFFSPGADNDYERAAKLGEEAGSTMEFTVTISSDDLDGMIESPGHEAVIVGTVTSRALSASPMTVSGGIFNLFVENPEQVDTRNMIYRMTLSTEEGGTYFLHGFKIISERPIADLWRQTTTLYVTVHEGENARGPVSGKGILRIEPLDFAKQMSTVAITNSPSKKDQLRGLAAFGRFFAGVAWDSYGGVASGASYFNRDASPRKRRALRVGPPELHPFETSDGKVLQLTRYRGGRKGPLLMVHGAGVASSIFSTDLIETNLLEAMYASGYDCWLLDYRVSIALPHSEEPSNGDQIAAIDHPEAVRYIREATGSGTIQAMVHCYGSTTFFMAMLRGLQGVRSIVASQIACDVVAPTLTKLKSGLHLPSVLRLLGVDSLTAYTDANTDWKEVLYDKAIELLPLPVEERCDSAVCHRISFMYGLLYEHSQLTQRFHDYLHELFGVLNTDTFEHLAMIVRKGHLVSSTGDDVYMPHLERLNLPICFIHGANNACYLPESTRLTFDKLCDANGRAHYTRHVIPDYGHIDCIFGKNAARDVYPLILQHLDRTN